MSLKQLALVAFFLCLLTTLRCQERGLQCHATVSINGHKYDLSFPANDNSAENIAAKLCVEKGDKSDDLAHCKERVTTYLKEQVKKTIEESKVLRDEYENIKYVESTGLYARADTSVDWILSVDLEISDKKYGVQLKPEVQTPQQVAIFFCKKHFASISSDSACLKPANDQLEAALNKNIVQRTIRRHKGGKREKERAAAAVRAEKEKKRGRKEEKKVSRAPVVDEKPKEADLGFSSRKRNQTDKRKRRQGGKDL